MIAGAWFIVPKAIRTLKQKRFDMNVLMTVAVIGAIIIGEWAEAAAVTFLFALSELLESYSVSRGRRAIESLMELSPLTALVKRDGEVTEVDLSEVATDETIVIRSGAKVPLDGIVTAGSSSINQAPITCVLSKRMKATKSSPGPSMAKVHSKQPSPERRVKPPSPA